MAKIVCKGTVLKDTISSVLTAIAQVISLDHAGAGSLTYDSTTLDGAVAKTYDLTGYAEPGKITGELFYDPANSTHKNFQNRIGYSTNAPTSTVMNLVMADAGVTTMSFTSTGVTLGLTVDMASGLKAKFEITISGDPGFPHN